MATKLAFALDTNRFTDNERDLLTSIAYDTDVVKIGLEMFTSFDKDGRNAGFDAMQFVQVQLGKPAFVDLKILDVRNTMTRTATNIAAWQVDFFTLHAQAANESLKDVAKIANQAGMIALAVTVLTDLDDDQCVSRFGENAEPQVRRFARIAAKQGINGFVCSPKEIDAIRAEVRRPFVVAPGVRPTWAAANEQARIMTPREAALMDVDMIVVGRPIMLPPVKIGTSRDAARLIKEELRG